MSEQLLQCDACGVQVSSLNIVANEDGSYYCRKCVLLEEAQFCREEGMIGKAMELEKKAAELEGAKI